MVRVLMVAAFVVVLVLVLELPEYGGVENLLDPLTVQTGLPTAPD